MKHLFLVCALFAAPASAEAAEIATVRYVCDRGAQVDATYINEGEAGFLVLSFEGRQLAFEVSPSASGALFLSSDPAQPFTWWAKGQEAFLLAEHGGTEVRVYENCAEEP